MGDTENNKNNKGSLHTMEREMINGVRTDIALIQKDISQIQKIFNRIDSAVEQMSSLSKIVSIQEKILEMHDKRIAGTENRISMQADEELMYRKELSQKLDDMRAISERERDLQYNSLKDSIDKLSESFNLKKEEQDRRITALEHWRWWIIGLGAGLLFIANKIPWSSIF